MKEVGSSGGLTDSGSVITSWLTIIIDKIYHIRRTPTATGAQVISTYSPAIASGDDRFGTAASAMECEKAK